MKCILLDKFWHKHVRPRVCGYSDHDAQWKKMFIERDYACF